MDGKRFYLFYNELVGNFQQVAENSDDTNLFEREGKALTNFKYTLPAVTSDLAQAIRHTHITTQSLTV